MYSTYMKKKFIIVIIGISILLTGCFGGSDDSKKEEKKIEGFHKYSTEEFSLQVPDEWETLTPLNFPSDIPKNTLVAFRNNLRNPKFTANVVIVKNELSQEISITDYSKAQHQKLKEQLYNVNELKLEENKIIVEGKETEDSELKRFIQVSAIKGKNAYIAIGAFLASEDEGLAKKIETMVESFEAK